MAESHDYPFLSRNAFEELLDKFLDSKSVNRRRKTFITREDFDFCIRVLQKPANTKIGNAKERYWAKKTLLYVTLERQLTLYCNL